MAAGVKDLDFFQIKNELDKNIEKFADTDIKFSFEKEDFNLVIQLPSIDDTSFVDLIAFAKKYIENWRIHTFERGYITLQALNSNLFDNENLLKNIKLRLSGIYGEKQLEVTKKGNPTQSELSLVIALLEHFCTAREAKDPLVLLAESGCSVFLPGKTGLTFDDFAGYDRILDDVKETIIMPLKNPKIFDAISESTRKNFESNRPKAVLFSGPPGVGKTTMAKIIANESGIPLAYVPLENIMSAYYGESSKKLATIFDLAALVKPGVILFLDEIDSLAPSRNEKLFEATRRMLSILLRKIDGFESSDQTLTIGATNREQDLDPALLSRFDTILSFPHPGVDDISAILTLYAKQLKEEPRLKLAKKLEGMSPRAIKDVCKKAERIRARKALQDKTQVKAPNLDDYFDALL